MKTFTALASGLVLAAAAAAPALATSEVPLNVAVSSQALESTVVIAGTTVPAAAVGFTAFGAVVVAGASGSSDSTTTTTGPAAD